MSQEHDDFVKNLVEEEDSIDGFEEQVKDTIEAHVRQAQNRPISKSGRPESSHINSNGQKGPQQQQQQQQLGQQYNQQNQQENRNQKQQEDVNKNKKVNEKDSSDKYKRIYEALRKQSSQEKVSQVIIKLSKYIAFHHISLESFWKSTRIYASLDEFVDYCLDTGFDLKEPELDAIQEELTDQEGFVTIELLCKKIQPWHNHENTMLEFIREKVLTMVSSSKKKFRASSHNQKQAALNTKTQQQLQQNSIQQQQRPSTGVGSQSNKLGSSWVSQGSKSNQYLQLYKEKKKDQEKQLSMVISKNQSEQEYDTLIRMGEANEIQVELSSTTNYRAFKNSEGGMLVHVYIGDEYSHELTMIEFRRDYNSLKLAYNESRNLKIWEVLSENKKGITGRDFSKSTQKGDANPGTEQEGSADMQQSKYKKTTHRQQELKKVLLETMWLSNVLNEQSAILNKKGINANNPSVMTKSNSAAPSKMLSVSHNLS